jgi:hypothetical protein
MRRTVIVLMILAFASLACNLTEPPAPTPTIAPPPVLTTPVLGLNPVSGPPGTVINVGAAGFPVGTKVNLYLSPASTVSNTPVAQSLTIGTGGILSFAFQLPDTVNGKAIANNTNLIVTIASADNTVRASAIFIALSSNATAEAGDTTDNTDNSSGGTADNSGLFITSPAINASIVGSAVVVTGSGRAFNNRVGVQVLDANYKVLGSALATIQAGTNALGPWEVTVGFTQPAGASIGYIVAYTVNSAGTVALQASIPVGLAGSGVVTQAPTIAPTVGPTVPPVITAGPPATTGFITATP